MINDQISRFAKTAERFCNWVEGERQDVVADARTARKFLTELLFLVIDLPDLFGEKEALDVSDEKYKKVYKRFTALPFRLYSECFNPLEIPGEDPVIADLADDLADIWRDLKGG